jgi:hypothetical protein
MNEGHIESRCRIKPLSNVGIDAPLIWRKKLSEPDKYAMAIPKKQTSPFLVLSCHGV